MDTGDGSIAIESRIIESLRKVIDPTSASTSSTSASFATWKWMADKRRWDVTLTNPFCPLTSIIEDQMRNELVGEGVLEDFDVSWVFDPPWCPDQVSEEGRKQLRSIGFASM